MIMPSMKERLKFSVDVVNCAETMTVCLKMAIEESAYNGTNMNVHVMYGMTMNVIII